MEVWSQPEVGFAAQNPVFGFLGGSGSLGLSDNCVALLGYESPLWVGGGPRKMMVVFVEASGPCGRKWEALLCGSWVFLCVMGCCVATAWVCGLKVLPPSLLIGEERVLLVLGCV